MELTWKKREKREEEDVEVLFNARDVKRQKRGRSQDEIEAKKSNPIKSSVGDQKR